MTGDVRILLLADTHLGFDLPVRPRVPRRRRGEDFLANYAAALEPAHRGEVDLVVHGGDVFDRPGVSAELAYRALEPLARIAARGTPVFLVPGNHERARLPRLALATHPLLRVFDHPRTFSVAVRGTTIALSGFPFQRKSVRTGFPALLEATGWRATGAALRLLCLHQCAEGATVGPRDFTFRSADDVVRLADIPGEFAAVLAGHIHRQQVLTTDLRGRPLSAPVLYPGSIERTSLAEMAEPKGYFILRFRPGGGPGALGWDARALPARPMLVADLDAAGLPGAALHAALRRLIAAAPPDAVLRVRLHGTIAADAVPWLAANRLRPLAPPAMNLEVSLPEWRQARAARRTRPRAARTPAANLDLPFPA